MAEEDILYGKNRHLFGGIEPSNMLHFSATPYNSEDIAIGIKITATLPKNTIIDGNHLCSVGGAIIRKSTSGYPKDEFDGEEIANLTESGSFIDDDVVDGVTYYYSAFPYTKQGVYNRNKANRTSATADACDYLFGYDIDLADSNPSTRVSYPEDVQNYGYKSASMNFTTGIFDYGDWPSNAGEKFMPKPCCIVNDDMKYLNPTDYTKYLDGSDSDIYTHDTMTEWPKIYTKRWEENGVYHFRCCDKKLGDDWECWCNYDKNDNEIDHFYMSTYLACIVSKYTLSSRSNRKPDSDDYLEYLVDRIKYGNDAKHGDRLSDRLLVNDLLVMMAKSTNIVSIYGKGYSGDYDSRNTGSLDKKGLFWGDTSGSIGVKVFGIEDWWGNSTYWYRSVIDWVLDDGAQHVDVTPGARDGSNDLFDVDVNINLGKGSSGYMSSMETFPWGRLPKLLYGSSSTNECSIVHRRSDTSSYSYAVCGFGTAHGVMFARSVNGGYYSHTTGISYRPTKK